MVNKTNKELEAEIRRLRSDIRAFKKSGKLEETLRKTKHKRLKYAFQHEVGGLIRRGRTFKEAVKIAKKGYNKI